MARTDNELLHGQIGVKDEQIKDPIERARESNDLIAGSQKNAHAAVGWRDGPRPVRVPYKGSAPMDTELLGGQISKSQGWQAT